LAAISDSANSVPHIHPVQTASALYRPIARGEQNRRTLLKSHRTHLDRARPLLEQQKFPAGVICLISTQHKRELQMKAFGSAI
jgi:hypothetical protein